MTESTELREKAENSEGAEEKKAKAKAEKKPSWTVRVKNNPRFCGVGAGGVQFADGKALIKSARMAEWFREHEGYEVVQEK